MMVAFAFDIRHGFGFSAGAIDYVLNFGLAENPLMLLVMGLFTGAIYFAIFYLLIIKLDLKTPGREDEDEDMVEGDSREHGTSRTSGTDETDARAYQTIAALGGTDNIEAVDYCTTRLRLRVKDADRVDEKALKRSGARGLMKINKTNVQVVIGTAVEFLADAMKTRIASGNPPLDQTTDFTFDETASKEELPMKKEILPEDFVMPIDGKIIPLSEVPDEVFAQGMMGPGFAIVPSGNTVHSPIDGKVVSIFPTKHAIGLATDTGVEVLIHFGLDTVNLKGQGFDLLVEDGQLVERGDALLKVDMDYVVANAPSTVTPIVFTNLTDQKLDVLKTGNQRQGTTSIIKVQ